MLNSLYGKTGQKEYPSKVFVDGEGVLKIKREKQNMTKILSRGPDLYEIEISPLDLHPQHVGSLVYIANYITSKARLLLFDAIYKIHRDNGRVYYCDTDSIFTDSKLPQELLDEDKLGLWKCEYEIKRGKFFGSKSYVIETMSGKKFVKFKGIGHKYLPDPDILLNWNGKPDLEVLIDTTWKRKWGQVENEPMVKLMRETMNRRLYDILQNNSVCMTS